MTTTRPELALDLYTDDAIRDPHPSYRASRDCAPAVWLPAHGVSRAELARLTSP